MRIGIDLGGTKTEGLLLGSDGDAMERLRRPTPAAGGYSAILDNIARLVEELEQRAGAPCSVGVGIPGVVDAHTDLVKNANTTALIGEPLRADLGRLLDREIRVANDANCFAVAEARRGAARGYRVVFGAILGTGCGGGLVIDGKPHVGRHGIAGEWGHSPIEDRGPQPGPAPRCYCGQLGCLELRASGTGFERDHARLARLPADATVPAPQIVERAHAGDATANLALDRYIAFLAEALARMFHIVDPDAVVLGGGMSNVDALYERLPAAVEAVLFNPTLEAPILKNALGDSAGVYGAAWLWDV